MNKFIYLPLFTVLFTTSSFFVSAQNLTLQKSAPGGDETGGTSTETSTTTKHIALSEVAANIGNVATVCGKVYDIRLLKNIVGQPTLMNLGGDFANERIDVRIRFYELAKFDYNPRKIFLHKNVCITGTISNEHGFTEISMDSASSRLLLAEAMNIAGDASSAKETSKLKLVQNAYLLAGSNLDEPIISHLKIGSVVLSEYSTHGFTYVRVIERANTEEQPQWMYGFIRNQALGVQTRNTVYRVTNSIVRLFGRKP